MKAVLFIFATTIAVSYGIDLTPTNYDLSRNRLGNGNAGSYGPQYPSGPYYPGGGYQGQYQGQYQNPGLAGPPGAHPGCPLCDSSVYSYCSYKQSHDACCCDNPSFLPFTCRKSNCGFLYANSCQEFRLISDCCCVDLYKSNPVGVAALPTAIAA